MREVLIITRPETVKVLSEETRFRILQLLRERPMTINELSEALQKDRTTVYRHIKALEAAGLVEELKAQGNERIYSRSARLFLIKADPDEKIDEFRDAYLRVEAEKLVEIMVKAGFKVSDRKRVTDLVRDVLNEIELNSRPVIKRISEADVELTEVELFHLLNILVFLQSCELCEKARLMRDMLNL